MLSTDNNIIHLKEVDSTNKYAIALLSKTNPIEGTVIRADYQSAGKGQIGRYWHSEAEKNLLLSFILYPTFMLAKDQFLISQCVTNGIAQALFNFGITAKVKWPNDIYVNDKKLAGVLIQNQLHGKFIKNTVIGIGMNVNQNIFPEDLPNPTSLALLMQKKMNLESIFFEIKNEIRLCYNRLCLNQKLKIKRNYLKHMYKYEQIQLFKEGDEKFEAIVAGVTPQGQLLLKYNDKVRVIDFREVDWLIN